jgi:hypothetical protein
MDSLAAIDMTIAPAFATPYQSPISAVQTIKGMTNEHDIAMAMIRVRHKPGAICRRFHSNTVVELLIRWHVSHLVNQPAISVDIYSWVTW